MTHAVETMFSVRKVPWHKLGVVLRDAPTVEQGIRAAGLDWEVALRPMFFKAFECSVEEEAQTRAVIRQDNGVKVGEVGPAWTPLQNLKAFEFFQPFLDARAATLECAGSLFSGSKVFVLAKIGGTDEIVAGDAVERYILLSNAHDGTSSLRVGFTPVRVVCNNTLSMAMRNGASQLLRLRHCGDLDDALDKVGEAMDVANSRFEATAEQYRQLAKKVCSKEQLKRLVKIVFSAPPANEEQEAPKEEKESWILKQIEPLFEGGAGTEIAGVRGTLWGAYNAITEYLAYERGNNDERRLANLWFGQAASMSQRALSEAIEMARAA